MESEEPAGVEVKPKALILVKGLGLGGAERLLVDHAIARHGQALDYVVAYVRRDKTHFVPALEAAGIEVVPVGTGGRWLPWPLLLAQRLRDIRPDIVHSHSPLPAAVARVLVAARLGGRTAQHLYTEHNRWSAYRLPTRLVNAATMVFDKETWAVSDEARSSVRPKRLRRRVLSLHHGIDLDKTILAAASDPIPRPELAPGAGKFTYIHVANRRPEKAHEVLLDAFAIAAGSDPALQLWLVGQRLDDEEFMSLVAANPASERIEVLGYRSDAPSLLARADALVLSSDHEGLPVVVMEALALGRPVVATSVGGIVEAVTNGVEALLVDARNPRALAEAMIRLHREPDLYARLGSAAAKRSGQFRAERAREIQESRYLELVGPR